MRAEGRIGGLAACDGTAEAALDAQLEGMKPSLRLKPVSMSCGSSWSQSDARQIIPTLKTISRQGHIYLGPALAAVARSLKARLLHRHDNPSPRRRRFARAAQRKSHHVPTCNPNCGISNLVSLRFPIGIIGKRRSGFFTLK